MKTLALTGADGVHISLQESGDPGAPPVVLLHALGDTAGDWRTIAGALAADYRVLAVDLRGHGGSGRPGKYSFELMRDDVAIVLEALDLRNVILVGHSMGGVVAYLVALAQPGRLARLVIEDAPPPYPRTRALPEQPPGELPFDWAVVPAIAGQVNDPSRRWWPRLPEITVPTLLVGGGNGSHIPQELLAEAAELIPDCALVTLEAGHNVHAAAPHQFLNAVTGWLGERAP
ncbi:3-oxoadipate enol-lactonase [Pseudarthrobacter defluvii]|uniref:alpha/beta fold hydrolase n=1 Tax=Pseudarthrobacter defluvii TaxID=410837 RepID=UPI002780B7E1|nr:alpha/beta fold hydrolase [Pseudarthrobacter defluvii]MDQ0770177.1 3-oxoadipate enol-lactonase [Pseudarthrobacter defluvii]